MVNYALLVVGQSNTLGVNGPLAGSPPKGTTVADLPPDSSSGAPEEPHPQIRMYSHAIASTLYTVEPVIGNLMLAQCPIQSPLMFDQSVCFAFHMAKQLVTHIEPADTIVIIHFGVGGTSLAAGPFGTWYPGRTPLAGTFNFYDVVLPVVQTAVEAHSLEMCAILWHQGEADSELDNAAYRTELPFALGTMRNDLDKPNLPVIVGTMSTAYQLTGPAIHQTHLDMPSLLTPQCATADMLDLADLTLTDNTHFTRDTHRVMGQRYYEAFIGLNPTHFPVTSPAPTPSSPTPAPPTPAPPTPAPAPVTASTDNFELLTSLASAHRRRQQQRHNAASSLPLMTILVLVLAVVFTGAGLYYLLRMRRRSMD